MSSPPSPVGYLVITVSRDRVPYVVPSHREGFEFYFTSWIDAMTCAAIVAEKDRAPVCLIRAGAQEKCAQNGILRVFELSDGSGIFVQAVFAPAR